MSDILPFYKSKSCPKCEGTTINKVYQNLNRIGEILRCSCSSCDFVYGTRVAPAELRMPDALD